MTQFLPILIIAGSAALYHANAKSLGGASGNPWGLLALTYFFSFAITAGMALLSTGPVAWRYSELRPALPAAVLLGLACVGIEAGYLLAYRGGWAVTHLFSITSVTSTLAIFSVGFLFFKEALPFSAIVGLTMVLAGIGVAHWR